MIVGDKAYELKFCGIFGVFFVVLDAALFSLYWFSARSELGIELAFRMRLIKAWNTFHSLTNYIAGPDIFYNINHSASDWDTFLALTPYLMLCFIQIFIFGCFVGFIYIRIFRHLRG